MNNIRNEKKTRKTTKIERFIMATILTLVILTPLMALTLSSINLMNIKQISQTEKDLVSIQQELSELEIRKQEKITYDQVQEYAAAGGLEKNEERVQRVRVN